MADAGTLLPHRINRALAAHDELKYYLKLLRAAGAHAQAPNQAPVTLRPEREASGVTDASLDAVVAGSRVVGPGVVEIPGAASILNRVFANIKEMLDPVLAGAADRLDLRERAERYRHRFEALMAQAGAVRDDQLPASSVVATTRRSDLGGDSLQQLAIELQWELNRLQANVVVEIIDGAETHGLDEGDRLLVRAFMKGVTETATLKFDHPGFRTRVMREGDHLMIQNDLGTAHASIRIGAAARSASVIYTDPQRRRVRFLRDLLRPYGLNWDVASASGKAENDVARYEAASQDEFERFLAHVGSRLVFLIDWNRARQRLASLVTDTDAMALLKWAADNNIGHRAFLQAGDLQLVHAALERAAPSQMRTSGRLDDLLGRDAARLFLMAVLRICSSGLSSRRSPRLIDDEIEAELLLYLKRSDRMMLGAVADHATVIAAAAEWIGQAVTLLKTHDARPESAAAIVLIRAWRTRADDFVRRTLRLIDRASELKHLRQLLANGDRAVRSLEQAAFTLTLVPAEGDPALMTLLDSFCSLFASGVREYVRLLEEARDLTRAPHRADLERFLVAVDRHVALDDHCDEAKRTVLERLIRGPADFRVLHLLSTVVEHLSVAFDALLGSSLIVRDHVLGISSRS
jgi:hypothetical protein